MCYSTLVEREYDKWVRVTGNFGVTIHEYLKLYGRREELIVAGAKERISIPRGTDLTFLADRSGNADVAQIQALISKHDARRISELEQNIFAQRKRLADAERKLEVKVTKAAAESARIARKKVNEDLRRLSDLKRTTREDKDDRTYPGVYSPVIVEQDGQTVALPMRFLCRPEGAPAFYDTKFSGAYCARRDTITEGTFWRNQWTRRHGVLVVRAFYENVDRHRAEGRELAPGEEAENAVIEFNGRGMNALLLAVLWSDWRQGDDQLYSYAIVTDEPPMEVAAAGHDRCPIPLKPSNVAAWLSPGKSAEEYFALLDDRERPYYEHKFASAVAA